MMLLVMFLIMKMMPALMPEKKKSKELEA